jgi:hypothetical protein
MRARARVARELRAAPDGERAQGPSRGVPYAGDRTLRSPPRSTSRSGRLQSSDLPRPGSLRCGRALQTRGREMSHRRPGTGWVGRETRVRISGTPRVSPRRVRQCSRARESTHSCAPGGVCSSLPREPGPAERVRTPRRRVGRARRAGPPGERAVPDHDEVAEDDAERRKARQPQTARKNRRIPIDLRVRQHRYRPPKPDVQPDPSPTIDGTAGMGIGRRTHGRPGAGRRNPAPDA